MMHGKALKTTVVKKEKQVAAKTVDVLLVRIIRPEQPSAAPKQQSPSARFNYRATSL
jgi:hypothetical protein